MGGASDTYAQTTLAPNAWTSVATTFELDPRAALVVGTSIWHQGAFNVCVSAPVEICVTDRCKSIALRACRDLDVVDLVRAVAGATGQALPQPTP